MVSGPSLQILVSSTIAVRQKRGGFLAIAESCRLIDSECQLNHVGALMIVSKPLHSFSSCIAASAQLVTLPSFRELFLAWLSQTGLKD